MLAAHKEENIDEDRTVEQLAGELKTLASWLDLERVKVSRGGPFARKRADRSKAV